VSTAEWSGEGWQVTVSDAAVTITRASGAITFAGTEASRLHVRRRWFRWRLVCDGRRLVRLRGVGNANASALGRAIRGLALAPAFAAAVAWHAALGELPGRGAHQAAVDPD
jgi:hypothetical protein